jgi:hypothetical protein
MLGIDLNNKLDPFKYNLQQFLGIVKKVGPGQSRIGSAGMWIQIRKNYAD